MQQQALTKNLNSVSPRGSSAAVYIIFFLSGVAGLGYEIVWTRMFAVGLGHEMPSVLAVLAAFFGGLAVGAWGLDRLVSRSRVPGRWYAGLELLIGVWGFVSIGLIPWANDQVALITGTSPGPFHHWMVAFLVPFLTLLPATAAMGATLPAMDRFLSRLRAEGRSLGGLYGTNTLGAVAGTLAATFVLVPSFGFSATISLLAAVNLVCAAAVFAIGRAEEERPPVSAEMGDTPAATRINITIFLAGFLGIGYEVLGVRVMSQVLENTVYSFASILSAYLFGTALGGVAYQALARRWGTRALLTFLVQSVAAACLLGVIILAQALAIYESLRQLFGGGFGGSVVAEMLLALIIFLLPATLMGALFSHLAQSARQESGGVGRALGLNTLGASLAPLVVGVLLLPAMGTKTTLILAGLGYLLFVPELRWRRMLPGAIALFLAFLLVTVWPAGLTMIIGPPGSRVLSYREGMMATVSALADAQGNRILKVNNRFIMGGTPHANSPRLRAHFPLLLHPEPRRTLFLGLGAGVTFGAVADHPHLRGEGVELIPEVARLLPFFRQANGDLLNQRRLRVVVSDARRYVRASTAQYDVIAADLFHPSRNGAGSLYTVEHFQSIRNRLASGGLFCQWLPLYQLDEETVKVMIRTFVEVFPNARAFYQPNTQIGTLPLALVGTNGEPMRYPYDWFAHRVTNDRLGKALGAAGLTGEMMLFGYLATGSEGLLAFAADSPLNTDDRPRVTFGAPRFAYEIRESPHTSRATILDHFRSKALTLQAFLDHLQPRPEDIMTSANSDEDREFSRRLHAYLAARDIFFEGRILEVNGRKEQAIAAYEKSVETSDEFKPSLFMLQLHKRNRSQR